jgi:hypothetical protein
MADPPVFVFSCLDKNNNYSPFSAEITDKFAAGKLARSSLFFDKAAASCYNPFSDGCCGRAASRAGKSYHNKELPPQGGSIYEQQPADQSPSAHPAGTMPVVGGELPCL